MLRVMLGFLACLVAYPAVILAGQRSHAREAAVLVGAIAFYALLFIGLPLVYWFIRKRWLRLWQFLVTGAFIGVLAGSPFLPNVPEVGLFLMLVGGGHGFLFWLVAIYGNSTIFERNRAPRG